MCEVFLADTDRQNIDMLRELLAKYHAVDPAIWHNNRGYYEFLDNSANAIVFIRVDNCAIPGLEITQAAIDSDTDIHVVWMAQSGAYALDAFRYGADAYLLLPATEETLRETINSQIDRKRGN